MAIGKALPYDQFGGLLVRAANPQWDDPQAGAYMFALATSSYAPAFAHTTAADLGVAVITTGDGAPIAATNRTVQDVLGKAYIRSNPANFGTTVTITAKYLLCLMPVTSNTYTTTAKLCWYVDLDDTSTNASLVVTASSFEVSQSTNGWISIARGV